MQLQEIAESGIYEVEFLNDTIYEWDTGPHNLLHPPQVSFRYSLPAHYTHSPTGERFCLPPSYSSDLDGLPGFHVEIKYAIAMHITIKRNGLDWWRKSTLRYVGMANMRRPMRF